MDEQDREGYRRVGELAEGDREEDGFVFVSVPPPKGEKYAFSVPVTGIYSILVYPPSLSHWYGSATINLTGGVSLPTLYFHDDESPLLASPNPSLENATPTPRARWGFPPFLSLLTHRAVLVRSKLVHSRQGAELWLVNPSRADREVHEAGVDNDEPEPDVVPSLKNKKPSPPTNYPPKPDYPAAYPQFDRLDTTNPKQALLTSLSNLTNLSRRKASQILSHPLAQPVVPHLPPAVRSLVNVPGEWERNGQSNSKSLLQKGNDVASEFESARLYLAKWARVVAEEGERARRSELAAQARIRGSRSGLTPIPRDDDDVEDLGSSLGVFSLLPSKAYSKRPVPSPTRTPQDPITFPEWEKWAKEGKDELFVRQQIFRRGFSDMEGDKLARREGWEVLLGVVPWSVGGFGPGEQAVEKRKREREEMRQGRRRVYEGLKSKWRAEFGDGSGNETWKEEWHRIDVDCRRTDRNQPIYAVPTTPTVPRALGEEENGRKSEKGEWEDDEEEGGMASLNPHIAALRTILMTYHTFSPELGYVQGMSDLLSPIYVVFDANEGDAFWGLVGVMKMMESNFLRDQSGMKKQLSTLQQLISILDPVLYTHLERTDSLNLFFTFRWILIAFKREFPFDAVIHLWEVLWTGYYSEKFVLFVAMAVLESHREVIIRYLGEFDEVLKYANDLSGTIDLDTTLAQAEVLFLSYRALVEDLDKENNEMVGSDDGLRRRTTTTTTIDLAADGQGKGKDKVPAKSEDGLDEGLGEGDGGERKEKMETRAISEELRELLVSWKPEH
ncbi:Rab GTPase activator, putative [Cryptococcus deneoformans JEC21]|uniref:Rab GTPase activator, putative n=1 Tax=Cryptococcus deneoformans (strain JEC21 / ATCC MYA-565) TaxID=214684 RepID=Q5K830_CRYD1|nr:Rab GTPase activator, putative [Cryptococcus neoformans var. neoformans JEC21]AAW46850.2 Rab GTPase activator, putative [Cryptococcus neoformans var. neoformans JEC21]